MIELMRLNNETGQTVFDKLQTVITEYDLGSKIVCFAGDNCPTNFGSSVRGGNSNVFARLQRSRIQLALIGSGCSAHLVHKSIEKACHQFQFFFDIEAVVVKIYTYFKNISVRNTRLQQMFSDNVADEVRLLGFSNTRFVGFKNCIQRIIDHFDLLKAFFLNDEIDDAPLSLIQFLNINYRSSF